jgi:myosin-1
VQGKTENAKKILQYLAAVSHGEAGGQSKGNIKERVLSTNPLLESFGNAKTLRNDNSSRFGKYLEVEFDGSNAIVGAKTSNFLLEKSRVTFQSRGERSFHILYQLTCGASAQERNNYCIYGPEDYLFTSAGGCVQLSGVDDAQDFKATRQAMSTIGIDVDEQQSIIQALAAILWLGNIRFTEQQDCAQIENTDGTKI